MTIDSDLEHPNVVIYTNALSCLELVLFDGLPTYYIEEN